MIIVEFTIDHPVLLEPLNRVPGVEVVWEETYDRPEGPAQMIVWIDSDDFAAIDAAVDDDPSVENPTVLTEVDGRRLYRVDFTGLGRETNLMPQLIDAGSVLQKAVGTNDGWQCRGRFPDRDAVEQIHRFCREHDIEFSFDRIYEQADREAENGPALSDAQRETLIEAVDSGYLAIPRECSLAELGERLDVSESAASERFRRAVRNLVERTVYP